MNETTIDNFGTEVQRPQFKRDENDVRLESQDNFFSFAKVEGAESETNAPDEESHSPVIVGSDHSSRSLDIDFGDAVSGMAVQTSKKETQGYKWASRVFLLISVISALVVLALEIYIYAVINIHKTVFHSSQRYTEISIYLSLFIFAAVYQVLLTVVGLRTKNMLLLTMLCCFYGCMLIYTGIQYEEMSTTVVNSLRGHWKTATEGVNIAAIVILAATMVVQSCMIFRVLRKNVKWFRYKKIGADLRIKRLYSIFQLHRSLLIFDFFFFLGFTVQFVVIMVSKKSSVEFILTVCVLPLTIIVLLVADLSVCREIILLTALIVVVFTSGCAYVLFKIIRLYTKYTSAYNIGLHPGSYFPGRKSLITFGVITLVLLFATIFIEVFMMFNYNSGMLPLISTYYWWFPGHERLNKNDVNRDVFEVQETANEKMNDDGYDDESLMIN